MNAEEKAETEEEHLRTMPRSWFERPETVRYRVVRWLASATNGWVPSPEFSASRIFYAARDAQENEDCRPKPGQIVDTFAVWATEAYTPDSAGKLIRGLERLQVGQRGLGARDAAQWVSRQRHRPGSTFELYLTNAGRRASLGFSVELPGFAASATGTIRSITPSLTLVTIRFDLTDSERSRLIDILNADHPTRIERRGPNVLGIFSPDLERRRLISEARADWAAQATAWFADRLPGLFSASGTDLPTCELSIMTNLVPFPRRDCEDGDRRDSSTLSALLMDYADVFESDGCDRDTMRFVPHPDFSEASERHSIVAMTSESFAATAREGATEDAAGMVHDLDRRLRPVVAQWSIAQVLEHYDNQVRSARDGFSEVVGGSSATGALARVRRDTASCADAETVARDILDGLSDRTIRPTGCGLRLRPRVSGEASEEMAAILAERLESHARSLLVDVGALDRMLHAQASLLSAHANLRLQPWIILLAVVSMIAGVIAAVEPVGKLLAATGAPFQ